MKIIISGIVQGVGFRPFVHKIASECNLSGYIQNQSDGVVEICIQGKRRDINLFLKKIKEEKPILAKYENIEIQEYPENQNYQNFTIRSSSENIKNYGSSIHPDVSICSKCIEEFFHGKRRRNYYFVSCTDCGPKYTIFKKFPYDRANTTMNDFSMCPLCHVEYNNPYDRLFHYELISCKDCGPRFSILDSNGSTVECKDPILYSAKLLKEGNIIAAKGIGGFHLITSATDSDPIKRIRIKKNRKKKPFAVMSKDLKSVRSFAILNEKEKEVITSLQRPIVILEKSDSYYLSPWISPALNSIGVMLPYNAFQILLLNHIPYHTLVMTSGNYKDNPIISDNKTALKNLTDCADYFLTHDREIFTQCDDSIVKIIENNPILLRGSRGFSPLKISFPEEVPNCILALGCEKNLTFSIAYKSNCFLSQHIGNINNSESYRYYKSMIDKMIKFYNQNPLYFACDMHPTMVTTKLAFKLSNDVSRVFQIQHHHAHLASLMAEYGLQDIIGIICDGSGYGLDGSIWGGEIFQCENIRKIKRIGHLREQPLIGGDLATIYPLRMVVGMLMGNVDGVENFLYSNLTHFPMGEKEIESIISINKSRLYHKTTSTGRVLDAISSLLGICYQRTFEGEPAISLESNSINGKDILISPKISDNVLDTTYLLKFIFENKNKFSLKDLAYSAHVYIAKGLANIAIENALSSGIKVIGFSGGVASNKVITKVIKEEVEKSGVKFLQHKNIPPGDGGISVGQAYYTMSELLKK